MLIFNKNTQSAPTGGTTQNPQEGDPSASAGAKGEVVPLWKLSKTNEKLKEIEAQFQATQAKLKQFEDAERKKQEDEAKAKGEFEKLLAQKEQERLSAIEEKEKLQRQRELDKLEMVVMKEVNKLSPNDPDDVLKFLDVSKFQMDNNGQIANLKESLDKLKADKPYLFGKTSGRVDPEENGRPAVGSEALKVAESEHAKLLSKSQTVGQGLTPDEKARMRHLHVQIQKLKTNK